MALRGWALAPGGGDGVQLTRRVFAASSMVTTRGKGWREEEHHTLHLEELTLELGAEGPQVNHHVSENQTQLQTRQPGAGKLGPRGLKSLALAGPPALSPTQLYPSRTRGPTNSCSPSTHQGVSGEGASITTLFLGGR